MISWIVTGFGPFAGVPDNPTMTIVQSLIPYLAEEEEEASSSPVSPPTNHHSTTVPLSQRIHTLVVETSYRAAQEQMEEIYLHHPAPGTVILLHLGVNYSGKHYQLESCAYNEMQFRVPDQRGDQPMNCPIVVLTDHSILLQMIPYQASVSTNLYHLLEPMCQQLNDTHRSRSRRSNHHPITSTIPLTFLRGGGSGSTPISTNHDRDRDDDDVDYGTTCVVSTDPGRFVCNYIYYYSLSLFRATTDDASGPVRRETTNIDAPPPNHDADSIRLPVVRRPCTNTNNNVHQCLFVHVPPLTVASVSQQLRFVTDLMRLLERKLSPSSSSSSEST